MEEKLRKIGIDIIEDVPWGTHFCQFFQTENDLLDLLVPYFKVGLENNEFCMWVTSKPLNVKKAQEAMRKGFPDFDYYLKKGQIEIIPHSEWYFKEGVFNHQMVLSGWICKHNQALANGYDGMRVTGNTAWLETSDWRSFIHYEEEINNAIGQYRLIALCTYLLDKCGPHEILEVARNHQFAIIRREGNWQIIESYESKQAGKALKKSEWEKHLILQSVEELVTFGDRDLRIIWANRAAGASVGESPENLMGRFCYEVWQQRSQPCENCPVQEAIKTGQPQAREISSPDGRWWAIRAYPAWDEHGDLLGVVEVTRNITARKAAEETLRITRESLELALKGADLGTWDWNNKTGALTLNERWAEMLGYRLDKVEPHYRSWEKLVHPEDLPAVLEVLTAYLEGKTPFYETEYRMRHKSGAWIWVVDKGKVIERDAQGKPMRACGTHQDITERKRAEVALRESEERFRTLLENIDLGINLIAPDYRIKMINPRGTRFFRKPASEFIGKECFREFRNRETVCPHCPGTIAMATGRKAETETQGVRDDGSRLPVRLQAFPYFDARGEITGFIELVEDITQRLEAGKALRESEEKYRLVFEKAPMGIMHYDQTSTITASNEIFAEIIGAPREKFIGFNMIRQLRDEKMREAVAASLKGEVGYYEGDYLSVTAGKVTPVRAVYQPLFSLDGALAGGVAIFEDITARKAAEAAVSQNYRELQESAQQLEQSRNMLQLIIESVPVRVFWKDRDLRYLGCNTLFARDAGLSHPQQLLGKDDFVMGWKEQADLYRSDDRQVMESRRPKMNIIEPQTTPGGDKIWLSTSKVPLQTPNGEVLGVLGVYEDITERKRAEENLRQTRDYLDNLINHANAPIIVWDPSSRITRFNRAFENLTGYSAQEVVGQKLNLLFPEASCEESLSKIARTSSGEYWESVEIPILHKDGDIRIALWNSANIHAEDGATLVATIAQGQDITERKRAEEAFRVLVNYAPIGIYIIQDGNFKMINPGFEKITGYTAGELLGSESVRLVSPDYWKTVRENAIRMLKGELDLPYEFPFITKSGETRWVVEKVTSTIYQGKRAALGYFMDINEHKSLEDQFLQAQKMEAVGRLAGGVAHDFNNILMGIMGFGELMKLELRKDDPLYHSTEEIVKVAERGSSLTRQLLAFSRKQVLQPQVFNLNTVVTDLEKMLRRLIGEDIDLIMVLDQAPGVVKADPGQIEQVIMNLAVNAKDAMPKGGKLTLKTANVYFDDSYSQKQVDVLSGPYVILEMSDNGIGMDKETQAHIFEPFFTTKESSEGTGLGLSTVYGIVKQSGGHIEVRSRLGQGTTFKIFLPQVEEAVESPKMSKASTASLQGKETILVVEDEYLLRAVVCKFLRKYGYQLLEARHGGEALLICERYKKPINLILTDVVMPQMGGPELAERLRPLHPEMKVIYMSGYPADALVKQGIFAQATPLLLKPFKPIFLVQKVREVLDASQNGQ